MTTQQDVPPDSWPGAAGRVSHDPGHPTHDVNAPGYTSPSDWPGARPGRVGAPATTVPSGAAPAVGDALPTPTRTVDPKAVYMWTLSAILGWLIPVIGFSVAATLWYQPLFWGAVVSGVILVGEALIMPTMRYRIHRWELTPTALVYRHGWLTHHLSVVPVNRIQTVESEYGPIARLFGLGGVKITTASATANTHIEGLARSTVEHLVAELTTIAGLDDSDAT